MSFSTTARKTLKAIHIMTVAATGGGMLALLVLRGMKMSSRWWPDAGQFIDATAVRVFEQLVQIGFYGILITAVLFALYTKWGFFRHGWIVAKWILTAILFSLAVFVLAPALSGQAAWMDVLEQGSSGGWDLYAAFETRALAVLITILIFFAATIVISTTKPWGPFGELKEPGNRRKRVTRITGGVVLALSVLMIVLGNIQIDQQRNLTVTPVAISALPNGVYRGTIQLDFPYGVELTVKQGKLTVATAVENRPSFYARLGAMILDKMVKENRIDVDAISGATTTSSALRKAAEKALTTSPSPTGSTKP